MQGLLEITQRVLPLNAFPDAGAVFKAVSMMVSCFLA